MRFMLILNILLLSLSWSARASNACHDLHDSLIEIERKLHAATLHNCGQLTPETLGLPPLDDNMRSIFDKSRCQNLAAIDITLGVSEAQLVMLDSLKDLRDQAVEHSQSLRETTSWTARQNVLAQSLTKDVTLGAAVQHVLEMPQLAELFSVDTQGPQWRTRLEQFCEGQTARSATPFCGIWTQHGPRSNGRALEANDLYAFLDDLRPLLNGQRRLDESKKSELLALMKLRAGDAPTDFKSFQERLAEVDFYQFNTAQSPRSLSDAQVKMLRQEPLSVPTGEALPSLRRMLGRVEQSKRLLQLKNTQELLKTTILDTNARLDARVKARWASLSKSLAQGAPVKCTDAAVADLANCIQGAYAELTGISLSAPPGSSGTQSVTTRTPVTTLQNSQARSVWLGASIAARQAQIAERCSRDDVVQALVKGEAAPAECELDKTMPRPQLELTRQIQLALRDRLRQQEETPMRFRSFAFDEMRRRECHGINAAEGQHEASPHCQGLPGKIAFGPAVNLAHDTMAIFFEGMRSQSELSTADCPAGEQGIYVRICNLAFNRQAEHAGPGAGTTTAPYRGTPATLSTDAPRRERDPIVRESLVNAASDIANTWLDVRMRNMQSSLNSIQMPPVRMLPYSQPMTMSLSDYVMTTATVYGGYGRYYQCPSCGVGSGSAFNSYWGLSGSAPVAGMGGTGLQGTGLSSRFFGAASSGAGKGFFSF